MGCPTPSYYLSMSRLSSLPMGMENVTSLPHLGTLQGGGPSACFVQQLLPRSLCIYHPSHHIPRSRALQHRLPVGSTVSRNSFWTKNTECDVVSYGAHQAIHFRSPHSRVNSITPALNNSAYSYCGGLYNLNIRGLQTTEIDLGCIQGERGRIRRLPNSLTTMPWQGKPRLDRAECV